MTTAKLLADMPFMPRWMGEPIYPQGFPMPAESWHVQLKESDKPRTMRDRIIQYYQDVIDDEGNLVKDPPLSDEDFQVLRQWLIYYLHAPIWTLHQVSSFEQLKIRAIGITTWKQFRDVIGGCLEFGLDPL